MTDGEGPFGVGEGVGEGVGFGVGETVGVGEPIGRSAALCAVTGLEVAVAS